MATLLTESYQLIASKSTSTYSTLRLYAKLNSQSTENNWSNVSFQARLYGNGGSGSFDSGTININGDESNLKSISYTKGSETTLKTLTYDMGHNFDGSFDDFTATAILTSSANPNGTCSGVITLPTIPRFANFETHVISTISQTEIVISWNADADCDLVEYSLNNGDWITPSETTDSSYTISSLLRGTPYSIKTRIRHAGSGLYTISDRLSVVTKKLKVKYNNNGIWEEVGFYVNTGDSYSKTNPYINIVGIWN